MTPVSPVEEGVVLTRNGGSLVPRELKRQWMVDTIVAVWPAVIVNGHCARFLPWV